MTFSFVGQSDAKVYKKGKGEVWDPKRNKHASIIKYNP